MSFYKLLGVSVFLGSIVIGCASQSVDLTELFQMTEKRAPVIELNESEYVWKDNRSYASNIVELAGGQYGLLDSFNPENAHVDATGGKRAASAAINFLGGLNILQTLSFDSTLTQNAKDAEFNPYIILFVGDVIPPFFTVTIYRI